MRAAALCLLALAAPAPPPGRVAGRVTLTVDGAARADASGVVVYVTGFHEAPPAAVPEIVQRGRRFEPALIAITAGQEVSFPNADPFFHNVFSVSPGQRFDLGQYKRGETKTRVFREPGPVEVYCNIHPEMAATILVLPNHRFALTAADGSFAIDGVPAGVVEVYAYDRLSSAPEKKLVTVPGGGVATVDFTVAQTRRGFAHKNKYGEDYRDNRSYRSPP
jgi:plastocyanin